MGPQARDTSFATDSLAEGILAEDILDSFEEDTLAVLEGYMLVLLTTLLLV